MAKRAPAAPRPRRQVLNLQQTKGINTGPILARSQCALASVSYLATTRV